MGHGINVISSANISIKGLNIKDCWGDCIYVGGSSKNVDIFDCKLGNGRRQGISITSADGVTIEDCKIKNVSGTNPQAAIDIEPNRNEIVDNIIVRNIYCENCYGGIETWRPDDARIGNVIIDGCKILNTKKRYPILVSYAENAIVVNCIVDADDRTAIMATQVENISIKKNEIKSTSKTPITILKCRISDVKENIIH